jgi:DNA-directed RNA polymerase specialized sigma24 family protein
LRPWFAKEVTRLAPELHATALRLTRNAADAEDLVEDAVAQAWRRRGALVDRAAFRARIFRILTNAFISTRRGARVHAEEKAKLPKLDEPVRAVTAVARVRRPPPEPLVSG